NAAIAPSRITNRNRFMAGTLAGPARLRKLSESLAAVKDSARGAASCPAADTAASTEGNPLCARMKFPMDRFQALLINVRVNLGRRDVGVAEHLLNDAQISAIAEQMRGKTVS